MLAVSPIAANEFETNSKNLYGKFSAALDDIERKVEEGLHRFPGIFEDLKSAQTQFRDAKMTREHSGEIWNRIDNLFKIIRLIQNNTTIVAWFLIHLSIYFEY